MREAQGKAQSTGRITSGIDQENTLALKTVSFVRRQLPAWRDDPDRPSEQAENKLNLQLCKFLDAHARNDFPMIRFDHEEYQSDRRSVDLSASSVIGASLHTIYDPVLVLECKRLPAPPPLKREKEYVTGGEQITGGIQRFKLGLHGAGMGIVAMIGYIQEQSPRQWHAKINSWISDLANDKSKDAGVWSSGEILGPIKEDYKNGIADCRSAHSRGRKTSREQFVIYHLWIKMNTRNLN